MPALFCAEILAKSLALLCQLVLAHELELSLRLKTRGESACLSGRPAPSTLPPCLLKDAPSYIPGLSEARVLGLWLPKGLATGLLIVSKIVCAAAVLFAFLLAACASPSAIFWHSRSVNCCEQSLHIATFRPHAKTNFVPGLPFGAFWPHLEQAGACFKAGPGALSRAFKVALRSRSMAFRFPPCEHPSPRVPQPEPGAAPASPLCPTPSAGHGDAVR